MKEMSSTPLKIGITLGDPNGIGPELLIREVRGQSAKNNYTPIIYGSSAIIEYYQHLLKTSSSFPIRQIKTPQEAQPGFLNCIAPHNYQFSVTPGNPTQQSGQYAYERFTEAAQHLIDRQIDGLVTNPVDKHMIARTKADFTGHTAYLTEATKASHSLMLMITPSLKVGTVTEHIPVRKVASSITPDLITKKLTAFTQSLQQDFGIDSPQIAVLGLNPHAGDKGLIGQEEQTIIAPVLQEMTQQQTGTFTGPWSADGFFGARHYKECDGVLGMYHDQILTPFKTLAFFEGVNFTAGLPVIRTSPDHGPAYHLAGKGEADTSSFANALQLIIEVFYNRYPARH